MRTVVSPEVMIEEMQTAARILGKWAEAVARGIPGVDTPASGIVHLQWSKQLVGELQIVANKCNSLAAVLSSDEDAR